MVQAPDPIVSDNETYSAVNFCSTEQDLSSELRHW
jgi:hypothetical protein